jgi:putative chitinase
MEEPLAVMRALVRVLRSLGFTNPAITAALGNIGKETGFRLCEEDLDYRRTPNSRIRKVFGSRINMSDDALTAMKQSPERFAEHVYGMGCVLGRRIGNTGPGDGWKFRGRGYIQITGRTNYLRASRDLYGDDRLVQHPEMLNDPECAATVSGWYLLRAVPIMAKRMGLDPAACSQSDMNLLYTSAIAGTPIRRGVGYLGNEVIKKVDAWADKVVEVVNE